MQCICECVFTATDKCLRTSDIKVSAFAFNESSFSGCDCVICQCGSIIDLAVSCTRQNNCDRCDFKCSVFSYDIELVCDIIAFRVSYNRGTGNDIFQFRCIR